MSAFKAGDLFTGKDRSYHRSLYQYLELVDEVKKIHKIKLLYLCGKDILEEETIQENVNFPPLDQYRLATQEEIESYMKTKACEPFSVVC